MVLRKLICVLLVACMLLVLWSAAPAIRPVAKAQVFTVIGIALGVLGLFKTGFNIVKFFLGDTPTQQAIDQLDDQMDQLKEIINQEEEIDEEIDWITDKLTFNSLLKNANASLANIKAYWGDENTQQGEASLLGMAQVPYDDLPNSTIEDFATRVMQRGDKSIEVGVEAFHQALVIHPPGCPNNALEQARDLAMDAVAGNTTKSDFSARVESENGVGIVAERPTYFNYDGVWSGGSCQSGIGSPGTEFYFAEGTTRPGFHTYFSIQNPGDRDADVKITYMKGDGTTQEQTLKVSRQSRSTVNAVNELGSSDGAAGDFSARVESENGVDIVAERPVYFNYDGIWSGGHVEAGIPSPGGEFYFAEGTTRPNFDSYICIQNPEGTDAEVKITYMKGDGTTQEQQLTVPKHARRTVKVADLLGSSDSTACDFSAKVESENGVGIVAERPVYFNYDGIWSGGHVEAGIPNPGGKFYFAEGTTRPNFDSYICIQNPEETEADVKITYMKGDGTTQEQQLTVPGHTRHTVRVEDVYQGVSLLNAYQDYLENLFVNSWIYQVMGTMEVCNAREYDPDRYGTSDDYINKYYMKYIQDEAEMFLKCTEQLVMSQADVSQIDRSHPDMVILPEGAAEVFEQADMASRMALCQGTGSGEYDQGGPYDTVNYGLFGRIIASQNMIAAGSDPPKIQAVPKDGGGGPYDTSTSENVSVPWISSSGSLAKYDNWTSSGGQLYLSLSGDWSVVRFAFDNIPEGTYNIVDGSGNPLAENVEVAKKEFQSEDGLKTYDLIYGSCPPITMTQGGPGFILYPDRWTEKVDYTGNTSKINDKIYKPVANPSNGQVGGLWFIDNDPKGEYHFYPSARLYSIEFIATEDMDINIFYGFTMKVYDTSDDAKEKDDNPSKQPNGYVSGYRGWLSDSFTSAATHKVQFGTTDQIDGNSDDSIMWTDSLSASPVAGGYSRHDQWGYSSIPRLVSSQHLVAGTGYKFCVRVDADMVTSSAQAKSNFTITLDGLRILGQ